MIASAVPQETYAMVGALTEESVKAKDPNSWNGKSYENYGAFWIENEYIRLYAVMRKNVTNNDKNIYLVKTKV